jgi:uncharacterized protein YukE
MAVIHMKSEELQQLAGRIRTAVNACLESYTMINDKTNHLSRDWYGGSADRFVRRTKRQLKNLSTDIDKLDALRVDLLREIDQWLAVDAQSDKNFYTSFLKPPPYLKTPEQFPETMDKIVREVDVSGRSFLWNGLMLSTAGGLGAAGVYSYGSLQYKDQYLDYSYEELQALYMLNEKGELPEGWPDVEKPKIATAKATLWEHEFGTAQAAVLSGQKGSELSGIDYAVLSAEASATASVEYKDGAIRGGAEGQAGIYLAKVSGSASVEDIPLGPMTAGAAVAGTAFVGAEICGEAKAVWDPKSGDVSAKLGGEAFAGGKVEGELEGSLGIGGVEGTGKVNASLNYGIGAQANADIGYSQGTLKADVQIGATLGLGFDVGFSLELNTTEAVKNIVNNSQKALDFIF